MAELNAWSSLEQEGQGVLGPALRSFYSPVATELSKGATWQSLRWTKEPPQAALCQIESSTCTLSKRNYNPTFQIERTLLKAPQLSSTWPGLEPRSVLKA